MGRIFFFRKTSFFRAKNKTVIRRGPNAILSLLLSGLHKVNIFIIIKIILLVHTKVQPKGAAEKKKVLTAISMQLFGWFFNILASALKRYSLTNGANIVMDLDQSLHEA